MPANKLPRLEPRKYGVPRIAANRLTVANCAEDNRVFLYENCDAPPFVKAVEGWKIVGWSKAPWPKGNSDFAVVFEKQTPAVGHGDAKGSEMPEGTRIWMHYDPEWLSLAARAGAGE